MTVPPDPALDPAASLAQVSARFRDFEPIARGGMGVVYRAFDTRTSRTVAVKLLAPHARFAKTRLRFEREMRLAAEFRHPHLVEVHDSGVEADIPFIVMELLEGETLEDVIRKVSPLPWQEALAMVEQVASGLSYLHERGILHRDVKPSNVMRLAGGGVKLLDFGLARPIEGTEITAEGGVLGTLEYIAPEVLLGNPPSPSADLWALGSVLYQLLTGTQHIALGSLPERVAALMAPFEPPSHHVPAIPSEVDALVCGLLSFHVAVRPRSAQDAVTRVSSLLRNTPADALAVEDGAAPDGYRIVEPLGAGAMGAVLRATQVRLRREVALKLMHSGLEASDVYRERFQREARAMSRVSHPCLLKLFEVGLHGSRPFISMELVEGRTLERAIRDSPHEVRRHADAMFESILEATAALHQAGLTHRDIKPANLMITDEWRPMVMDLGLVRDLGGDGTSLTKTGALVGTPAFLAPEVLMGAPATPRSDVWALGCLYFAMWAGAIPFRTGDLAQLYEAITNVRLPDFDVACPDMNESRRAYLKTLLARDPNERPRDARQALLAFRHVIRPAAPRSTGRRAPVAASTPGSAARLVGALTPTRTHLGLASAAGLLALGLSFAFHHVPQRQLGPGPSAAATATSAIPGAVPSAGKRPPQSTADSLVDRFRSAAPALSPYPERLARWFLSHPGPGEPPRARDAKTGEENEVESRLTFSFARTMPLPPSAYLVSSALHCVARLPDDARSWLALGWILDGDGRADEAAVAYRVALARKPPGSMPDTLWSAMAAALERAGQLEARWVGIVRPNPTRNIAWFSLRSRFPSPDRTRLRRMLEAALSDPRLADAAAAARASEHFEDEASPASAFALLNRMVGMLEKAPYSSEALVHALLQRGRVSEARALVARTKHSEQIEMRFSYLAPGAVATVPPAPDAITVREADQLELVRRIRTGDLAGAESFGKLLEKEPDRGNPKRVWFELLGAGSRDPGVHANLRAGLAAGPLTFAELEQAAGPLGSAPGVAWMEEILAALSKRTELARDVELARGLWHARRGKYADAARALEAATRASTPAWTDERARAALEIVLRVGLDAPETAGAMPAVPSSIPSFPSLTELRECVEALRARDRARLLLAARAAFEQTPTSAACVVVLARASRVLPEPERAELLAELGAAAVYNRHGGWLVGEVEGRKP